jgi:hypothetical protein
MTPDHEPPPNSAADAPVLSEDELDSIQGGSGSPHASDAQALALRSPEPN